jgi:hypothetical protein
MQQEGMYEVLFDALKRKMEEREHIRRCRFQHVGTNVVGSDIWMIHRDRFVNILKMFGQRVPNQLEEVTRAFVWKLPTAPTTPNPSLRVTTLAKNREIIKIPNVNRSIFVPSPRSLAFRTRKADIFIRNMIDF